MPKAGKITIAPGQGLLLLIDHYKDDAAKLNQLKKLYLCGAANATDDAEIRKLLTDPILAEYQVSYEAKVINNDPTRRYFETHLAYESLKNGLNKIDKHDLESHFESLKNMLPPDKLNGVKDVLDGKFNKDSTNNLNKEYADYIAKINSAAMFADLSTEDREKIALLVKCSFLGVVNAWHTPLPLNIYGTGIYSEKNKGKVLLAAQEKTGSQNLGLMKGHMPLYLDDIARSDKEIPYLKPSDQSSYADQALWVQSNFNRLVHPFSNSISGTMLCQLRSLAKLKNDGVNLLSESANKMGDYGQLLISAMLFNSGGHSLHEFTAPLALDVVKNEFKATSGFERIGLESMYLTNNETGFNAALEDAIDYNEIILLRENVRAQITGVKSIEPKNNALINLKTTQELNQLSAQVTNKKDSYAEKIQNQWFSSLRSGVKKNIVIQKGLNEAIKHMDSGKLDDAQKTIQDLKQELISTFGETNLWGQKSDSLKLVESVESDLSNIKNNTASFKEKLKKTKEEVDEPAVKGEETVYAPK